VLSGPYVFVIMRVPHAWHRRLRGTSLKARRTYNHLDTLDTVSAEVGFQDPPAGLKSRQRSCRPAKSSPLVSHACMAGGTASELYARMARLRVHARGISVFCGGERRLARVMAERGMTSPLRGWSRSV
jgi:hypothetical protein